VSTNLFVVDAKLWYGFIANIRRRFIITRGCDFMEGTVCMLMALGGLLLVVMVVVVVVMDSG